MGLERKKTMNVFAEAKRSWGSYDDYPVGPKGTDPMPHLSRNRVPQPFWLVCEADQVLIQMAGAGEIRFQEIEPRSMRLAPGDTVYIPAGVPSRLFPDGECVQIRLKAEPPEREAVAFYCDCGALVHARELPAGVVQDLYYDVVQAFNADEKLRRCAACGAIHPPADLGDTKWPEVAAAIRSDE